MIRDRMYDAYLLGSIAIGCVLAAPYLAYLILKAEIDAKL